MFGLRVQSTRQSVHTKDLPATLGHAAHLKATKRDVRPYISGRTRTPARPPRFPPSPSADTRSAPAANSQRAISPRRSIRPRGAPWWRPPGTSPRARPRPDHPKRVARPSQPTYVSVNASLAKNHLAVCMLYAMQTIALAYTCSALHRSER